MRHGSVITLLLSVALAVAPSQALAAEPGEPRYLVARGSFDPGGLCASLGPTCSVVDNEVELVADMSTDMGFPALHGAATYTVRWKDAKHPGCDPWTLTVRIELTGAGTDDLEAIGSLATRSDSEIYFGKDCSHKILQGTSAGDWAATLAPGQRMTGGAELSEQNVAMEIVDFTLDGTWQAEAPEGFFTQDYDSAAAAAFFADDTFLILHPELTEGMFEGDPGMGAVSPAPADVSPPDQTEASDGVSGQDVSNDAAIEAFFFLVDEMLEDAVITQGMFEDDSAPADVSTSSQTKRTDGPGRPSRHTRPFDDPTVNAFFFYFLLLRDHIVPNPLGVPVLDFTLDQDQQTEASDGSAGQDEGDAISDEAFETFLALVEEAFLAASPTPEEP